MTNYNPLIMCDGYKVSHKSMYPEGTTMVYSNYTCRSTKRMPDIAKDVVVFGIQYMLRYIHDLWRNDFFAKNKEDVCGEAKEYLQKYLGMDYDVSHFEKLHDLGYLPIEIKALPEGTIVKEGIPIFTIKNTHPDFFWVTNFLETLLSTLIWKPIHSASLAYAYKKIFIKYAKETDEKNLGFVDFQGHDFSFRGMQSPESAIASAMGFLTSFKGTDTIPALQAISHYYTSDNVAFSVPASEHSVMSAHGKEGEIDTLRYLMSKYPKGVLSVVSDTWDLWTLVSKYLPILKEEILARDGKLVIRPDTGIPEDIICGVGFKENEKFYKYVRIPMIPGEKKVEIHEAEYKGVIELLWDIFGGTINEQGYKVLDSHIGAIYGDSITLERAEEICKRLKAKGFASTNWVAGVGSYSMGYATRDNQGGAVKSTYCELTHAAVDGPSQYLPTVVEPREIFKDPITGDGEKKSLKGLLCVNEVLESDGMKLHRKGYEVKDQCTWEEEQKGLLIPVYKDGFFQNTCTFEEIRNKIK